MAAVLRFRRKNIVFLLLFLLIVAALIGPYIFIHFPRTCIPYVDPKYSGTAPQRIVILSGEQCTALHPESKCRILGSRSYYNRREYVAHHQGRYMLRDNFTEHFDDVVSQGAVPAWAKIKILMEELERNENDWIFWMDTDALFANMDITLERFVDTRYSMLITIDLNSMNPGVFFLKVNDWSRQYMRDVMSKIEPVLNEMDWMIKLLEDPRYESERHVKYLPQCSFNSYWQVKTLYGMYRPGDFVIHWAGHNFDPVSFQDWLHLRYFKLPF
ncbi:hypothetical protein BGX34_010578 [Mortierella sp. NVP85]|nr:hypothetical protein BGX34_010578 [Mortierella sp. NVP85]